MRVAVTHCSVFVQVLVSAANPPVQYYSFFLNSLLETVRINIGECASAAYDSLTVAAATRILMFDNERVGSKIIFCCLRLGLHKKQLQETLQFIADFYPGWSVAGGAVRLGGVGEGEASAFRSEQIASMKLITQSLSYATELERIV